MRIKALKQFAYIKKLTELRGQHPPEYPLSQGILPHLSRIRKEQIITINKNDIGNDNFEASLKTANRAGFTIVGEMKDKIECRQNLIKNRNLILTETYSGITYEEMVKQREKMNIVIGNLWQIKAEMEMKLGASNLTRELNRYIDKLELYKGLKPDDAVYDSEQVTKRNKL